MVGGGDVGVWINVDYIIFAHPVYIYTIYTINLKKNLQSTSKTGL